MITQACKKSRNTKFEIQEEPGGGLWMIFHFAKEKNTKMVTVKTTVETTVKTTVENSIIDFIAKNPKTTLSEIASQIGKSIRAVERAAAKLKREGKINFVGPKKSGHWEIVKQKGGL